MRPLFAITAGTQIGSAHIRLARNNQDGWAVCQDDQLAIAIVADGCGSATHSEVGAKLGSQMLCQIIRSASRNPALNWQEIKEKFINQIRVIASSIAPDKTDISEVVHDYFLFTIVGCVITPDKAVIFSAGDGYYAVNGTLTELLPMTGNCPLYLALSLINPEFRTQLSIHQQIPTTEIDSILLATDGLSQVANETVVRDFCTNSKYQKNPDCIRRKLYSLSRENQLTDDTTLIVIRRNTHE